MEKQVLHITNGTHLTNYLKELDFQGNFLTWEEMLCEGPTEIDITTENALSNRKDFFKHYYNAEFETEKFQTEITKLDNTEDFKEIVLWFEYDLFCHINLVAVISFIQKKKIDLPLFLVSSGWIQGQTALKGLSELSAAQISQHYKDRIKLTNEDIDIAMTVWQIYCGRDHNLLKPYIVKKSSFKYLSNCLKAHLERFPDSVDGLNILERNILEIVRDNKINSKHHLLGYALNYQGYYGFGDMQLERLIDKLSIFFEVEEDHLILNREGHEALIGQHNFTTEIDNNMVFGGVKKFAFQFNKQLNKLVKTVMNAH